MTNANNQRLKVVPISEAACEELLARKHIGRLAFSFQDHVDVQPLTYVFRDRWIFGRTSDGAKLAALRHNRWVAFQVDEIRDDWNCDSVVVRGGIHLIGEGGGAEDRRLREKAIEALKDAIPGALEDPDAAPHRTVIFGIAPHEVAGRSVRLRPVE